MVCKPLSWKASVLVSSVFEFLLEAQMRVAGLGLHLCASPLACSRRRVQGLHEGLGKAGVPKSCVFAEMVPQAAEPASWQAVCCPILCATPNVRNYISAAAFAKP